MNQAERYQSLCQKTGRAEQLNCSYRAAFYLLSGDQEIYRNAIDHISHVGVDFKKIKSRCKTLGETEQKVVDIAHNLFSYTSKCSVSPHDISVLGHLHMEQVANAIFIAANQFEIAIQQEPDKPPSLTLLTAAHERTKMIQTSFSNMVREETVKMAEQEPEDSGTDLLQEVSHLRAAKSPAPTKRHQPLEP